MASKVTIRKNGLRQMAYYVTLSDGRRKRQFVYGGTNEEVRAKYSKEMADAVNGLPVMKNKITVEQFLNEWIGKARKIRESTKLGYQGEIRKHIIPKIGNIRLSNLSVITIQQMMDRLIKEGVSPRTTRILKNILSKALREAEIQNLVKPNIMKYIELEPYVPKERKIWSEENAKIFLETVRDHKYYFFFIMYITYGLRRGEAIAIRWDDIDFSEGVIHIRRQYTLVGGSPTLCKLKTKGSVRDLPILPHIEKILEELRTTSQGDYVMSLNDNPINPVSVNYEFEQIKKSTNLPDVTLHSLRHFAATSLKNAGVTIKEAQEILGHSTPVTTMQYYQHSSIEDKRTALTKYAENMCF